MHAAWAATWLSLWLCIYSVRAAVNKTLDDSSFGWIYRPGVCVDACDGAERGWWQLANLREPKYMTEFYSGTEMATSLVGASATLQFSGTDIWYYSSRSPQGGIMDISLDGKVTTNVSSISPAGSKIVRQQLLWSAHDLDGSVQHELKITMTGGVVVAVDRIDITLPEPPQSPDPIPSPTPTPPAENNGGPPRGLKLAAIISGVVCGIFLLILLVVALYYFHRRKQQRRAYHRVDVKEQFDPFSKPLPPLPPTLGNTSVVAVNSAETAETESSQHDHVMPAWSPTAMTVSEPPHTAFSPFDPTAPVTFRAGPARQDGPTLRYALVRTASMRPVTVLVDEEERDPLSTRGKYRSRSHRPQLATISDSPPQSPTITTTDVQFNPYRQSQSEEIDPLALAIERDEWPQPPQHIPVLSAASSAETITPATARSQANVRAGSYSIPYPAPSHPPPTPPLQSHPHTIRTNFAQPERSH